MLSAELLNSILQPPRERLGVVIIFRRRQVSAGTGVELALNIIRHALQFDARRGIKPLGVGKLRPQSFQSVKNSLLVHGSIRRESQDYYPQMPPMAADSFD
jgi:hypothetical protein